jgi:hypothetical protein
MEPTVTPSNEELIRTYHPSLAPFANVWLHQCPDGGAIWVAQFTQIPVTHTHAGGLEVHVMPDYFPCITKSGVVIHDVVVPPPAPDLIRRTINPRRILTGMDLDKIRLMFPRSVGVRVLVCAVLLVLYEDTSSLNQDQASSTPLSVGGLIVFFQVLNCVPSAGVEIGQKVAGSASSPSPACLGLRLRLQDGTAAITTVTHAFVHQYGIFGDNVTAQVLSFMATSVVTGVAKMMAYLSWRKGASGQQVLYPPFVRTDHTPLLGNSPIGKEVQLYGGGCERVGRIRYTYDTPSRIAPYPAGYCCDLSLVCDDNLPLVRPSRDQPAITGWADMSKVLDGEPIFVTAYLVLDKAWSTSTGETIWNDPGPGKLDRAALFEGVQYAWDRHNYTQNFSLLWRTDDRSAKDLGSAAGYSGSVLCLGSPKMKEVKAVVFQNFQILWTDKLKWKGDYGIVTYVKGGFLLPSEIRESKIDCGGSEGHPGNISTFPRNRRSNDTSRRSFSNNV